MTKYYLNYLDELESEAIFVLREVWAQFENPVILFSGGKDSTYAIYLAKKLGHSVDVLLTLYPHSSESHLLHYPNIEFTQLQAESMKTPQLIDEIPSDDSENESKY